MDQIAAMAHTIIEFSMPPTTETTVAGSLVALSSQQFSLPTSPDMMNKTEALSRRLDVLCRDCQPSNCSHRCNHSHSLDT